MTTSESKGRFFYKTNRFESIRIRNQIESIRIVNWSALVYTMKSKGPRREPWEHGRRMYTRKTNYFHIWHVSNEMTHFMWHVLEFYTPWNIYSYSYRFQMLYTGWPREVLASRWMTIPQVDVVRVTWPISNFGGRGHTFRAGEFDLQVERK